MLLPMIDGIDMVAEERAARRTRADSQPKPNKDADDDCDDDNTHSMANITHTYCVTACATEHV